jgi:hypothetical protein
MGGNSLFYMEVMMNYSLFYALIRQYINGKISRRRFVLEWGMAQQEQNLV